VRKSDAPGKSLSEIEQAGVSECLCTDRRSGERAREHLHPLPLGCTVTNNPFPRRLLPHLSATAQNALDFADSSMAGFGRHTAWFYRQSPEPAHASGTSLLRAFVHAAPKCELGLTLALWPAISGAYSIAPASPGARACLVLVSYRRGPPLVENRPFPRNSALAKRGSHYTRTSARKC
jgi:hypothetical protein